MDRELSVALVVVLAAIVITSSMYFFVEKEDDRPSTSFQDPPGFYPQYGVVRVRFGPTNGDIFPMNCRLSVRGGGSREYGTFSSNDSHTDVFGVLGGENDGIVVDFKDNFDNGKFNNMDYLDIYWYDADTGDTSYLPDGEYRITLRNKDTRRLLASIEFNIES